MHQPPSPVAPTRADVSAPVDPVALLAERFTAAIAAALADRPAGAPAPALDPAGIDPMITPSRQAQFGDFQCNAAMSLAKQIGEKPRDLAQRIARAVQLADLAEPLDDRSIAGPGFINIRLRPDALAAMLERLDTPALGLPAPASPPTVVVDLCGVNLAKQMHVGHLRSVVVGDAVARLFERSGARVIRQNHVGDWGLPIAMVTAKLMAESAAGRLDLASIDLDTLNHLYRAAQAECSADRAGLEAARRWSMGPKALAELEAQVEEADEHLARAKATLLRLQAGHAAEAAVWQRIYDVTMAECLRTCRRLHASITDADSAGESSYRDELADLVADLERRGVAEASDGALIVRVDGIPEPCLVRKRDGGYLYATTDLAAVRRRVQRLKGDRVVYCVDVRQSLHFKQVFGAATKAGYATRDGRLALLEHAAYGTILGEDNKPFKTRSGENVRLSDLLDEAHDRALRAVRERSPDLPDADAAKVADAVAIGAIKYADLSTERIKDYVFSFDRMLAFEGNTGPYLLYAAVRIASILRKAADAGLAEHDWQRAPFPTTEPDEKALALALLRTPQAIRNAAEALEPARLCAHAYELAAAFSGFFDRCPVLRAGDEALQRSRLRLCDLTGRVLRDALHTLGLPLLDRM